MINDEVIQMLDKKISILSYSHDINSRGLLKIAKLEKQIHRIVYDFSLKDWRSIHTDEYFKKKDSIEGVNNIEKEYKKKLHLLESAENHINIYG